MLTNIEYVRWSVFTVWMAVAFQTLLYKPILEFKPKGGICGLLRSAAVTRYRVFWNTLPSIRSIKLTIFISNSNRINLFIS